jgi:hypothetical protein
MSDLRDFLGRGVEGFDPSPDEGLQRTRDRGRHRHRRRQFLAGAVTVAMFGGTLAAAVWLGGPRGRPIAGPTPSPTISSQSGQPTSCSPGFRNTGVICISRTSDVVEVATGLTDGQPWSVRGFSVVYEGPDPRVNVEARKGTHSELAMLCIRVEAGAPAVSLCQRALGDGIWAIEGIDDRVADPTLAPVRGLEAAEGNPLQGLEEGPGGFLGLPLHDTNTHLSITWTSLETARVDIAVDGGPATEARLAGPFAELGSVKWIVATVPAGAQTVMSTAYDADDTVLWEEVDHGGYPANSPPPIPNEPPISVAELSHAGTTWLLGAYSAASGGNKVLCVSFARINEDAGTVCMWAGGFDRPGARMYSVDVDGEGPLPAALFGAASPNTVSVSVSQGDASHGAQVYPAPTELGLDVVFIVAFADGSAPATTRGYDGQGNLLWTDVKTFPNG